MSGQLRQVLLDIALGDPQAALLGVCGTGRRRSAQPLDLAHGADPRTVARMPGGKPWPRRGHTLVLVAVSSCMPLSGVFAARRLFCAWTVIIADNNNISGVTTRSVVLNMVSNPTDWA